MRKILGIVLNIIVNASSPPVFFPKYLREILRCVETRRNEERTASLMSVN